ncbi:MAG TPA: 50S ribosomal protein L15 [Saprospiraceae bacterium]|nr:50S ribosomal protein L15 [Saprospiraceae bacterium]HMP24414.1 50S ribosomal protein L15 [Saprospiraceae bacterium]
MELHSLKPAAGATKKRKRIARGQGSGHGGTATRGHKGAKSRSGDKRKRNFEGGQMPLQMRVPKVGFKNPNRVEYVGINLGRLQDIAEKFELETVDLAALVASGIVRKNDNVKILGAGELKAKLNVTAHAFSATAKQAIEKLGGSVNIVK